MSWYPASLPQQIVDFAKAIDQRFQLINPNGPLRLPDYTTAQLLARPPTAYCTAINTTTKKPVFAALNVGGTALVWIYADGTLVA